MKIVVVGHGMVGHKFLQRLTQAETGHQVSVFGEEPRAAYDRVHLTSYLSGQHAADLSLVGEGFFEGAGIELYLDDAVVAINREAKTVTSASGCELTYDKLVLATGSYPFVPPIAGSDAPNCFVYRTIDDLDAISAASRKAQKGVVIGGGLLGLEAAKALKDLGLEVSVVEFAPRLMAAQVDAGGGELLRRKVAALGVDILTGRATKQIEAGGDGLRLLFSDGGELATDLVVFSAGIRPQDALAKEAGLERGERGGIVIDDHCRTSDAAIYAIGECALWRGQIFGLVAPGYDMASVACNHLLGHDTAAFNGADMSTKLKLLGVDVASIGDCHGASSGARNYSFNDEVGEVYKKLVVSDDGKYLLGAVLVGEAEDYGSLLQMMKNRMELPAHPEELILPKRGSAGGGGGEKGVGLGMAALPATAQICSCNNVTKGAICAAVDSGCMTLVDIKTKTGAGTSCGGCVPLVTQLLNHELASRGESVNNHLCEHFAYTRQELYHLVRVEEIRDFDSLLAQHGRGLGCELCKPTAASIFASCWNEHLLSPALAGLQDSNDYYLANIQKDGTYSVVPRVPAGEISADKLIVLGRIAKRYDLYTKITGGQRVDLLGARLEQLPLIWRELVEAGFESGHAYGKSMRTVKSCVGSTWCRYGVKDSTGLAIDLEQRYRGLRSPHKLKLAVSGCTRECAEAQGKDVGVIATEKGWNLYVGGNGGMKPRHADLLASDLDSATLVRYIDRFLMFYISCADKLQRTSVWLDSLEGGLDYVRAVVCDDSLGIASELEAQMAHVVDTYACEWKRAIDDPTILKRFRHFINDNGGDDQVSFVRERGQIRPANTRERSQRRAAELEQVL